MTANGQTNSIPIPSDGISNVSYNTLTNRITTAGFEYDYNGNQTRALAPDGQTWYRYEYDDANRLVVIKQDNGTTIQTQEFGIGNNRLSVTDSVSNQRTYYQGKAVEYTESNNSGVLNWSKSYVYLGDSVLSTTTPNGQGGESIEYNHPDALGTRLVSNPQTGTVSENINLPFGTQIQNESTNTTNKRKFTSYDRSTVTGLDYAVNRTYDSKQGRFTQVDPIGMSAASLMNPQTLNMYAYCGNDPINHTDPDGLFFGWLGKKLWGFVKTVFRAAVKAAIQAVFTFITSGGNLGKAVTAFVKTFVANLGLSNVGNVLTGGWNPNARHPLSVGSGGGLNSSLIIRNLIGGTSQRISQSIALSFAGAISNFLASIGSKPNPCNNLARDPGFQKFASNMWSHGNVNEAAGLIGLLVDDGSIPSSIVGLFQYKMWDGVGTPRGVGPEGAKWSHTTVNEDYGKIRYLFQVHTHPSGKGIRATSRLFPSNRKTGIGNHNDLDSLIQLQEGMGRYPHPMGSGPYTQGVIITDHNFSVWDASGKVICKGKW